MGRRIAPLSLIHNIFANLMPFVTVFIFPQMFTERSNEASAEQRDCDGIVNCRLMPGACGEKETNYLEARLKNGSKHTFWLKIPAKTFTRLINRTNRFDLIFNVSATSIPSLIKESNSRINTGYFRPRMLFMPRLPLFPFHQLFRLPYSHPYRFRYVARTRRCSLHPASGQLPHGATSWKSSTQHPAGGSRTHFASCARWVRCLER